MNSVLPLEPGVHPLSTVDSLGRQLEMKQQGIPYDVLAIGRQLYERTHDVIVAVGLPERSRAMAQPIARGRRRAFDGFQDLFELCRTGGIRFLVVNRCDQQVSVVGHDDEVAEVVTVTVVPT